MWRQVKYTHEDGRNVFPQGKLFVIFLLEGALERKILENKVQSCLNKVHNSESDIDALCVGPCFATLEDFFVVLHNMLTSRSEVFEVHCVKDAKFL
ncbi:Nuclear poly(A) polymerase 3 [Camellia lanceoleosa]|uniref:Nuclear poly(A) polymerase 3 n=1 Tax=Camellia lanceoleosa TaxID=1840588 RepID=A0ACC0GFL1_9ERIC|nr:Nuclear poly(A) polymerase 3 [Camellia lanceoleosa]